MILKGSQRSGAKPLAVHLLNERDNDHVTVFELRGFVASDLMGAFREAEANLEGDPLHAISLLAQPQSAGRRVSQ